MHFKNTTPSLILSSGLSLFAASLLSAQVSFYNDFTSDGFPNQSNMTLNTAEGTLTSSFTTESDAVQVAYGTEQFSNAANSSFTLFTTFQVSEIAPHGNLRGDQTIAFGVFATDPGLSGGAANPYLLADWTFASNTPANTGRLRLLHLDGSNPQQGSLGSANDNAHANFAATLNTTYTLRFDAVSLGGNMYDITLSLFDANGQIGTAASASNYIAPTEPGGGYYMGIRTRMPQNNETTTVNFHDFAAIPEPGTYALIFGGLVLAGALFRRNRQNRP